MAVLFSDDFNRANSTTLGGNWVEDTGDMSIASNQVTCSGDSGAFNTTSLGTNDYTVQLTTVNGSWIEPAGRVQASNYWNNCYFFLFLNGFNAWHKRVAGTQTQLESYDSTATTAGDYCTIEFNGTTLKSYKNGSILTTVTDSSWSSGTAGFRLNSSGVADDFIVSSLAGGGSTFVPKVIFM